jgi:hypothetical protein
MKITGSPLLKEIRLTPDTSRRQDAAGRQLPFAPGDVVRGRIAGLTPEGKVLLAIGDTVVEARSEVALKVGGEFWFEVRQAGAEPWLALAEKKGAAQELLRLMATGSPALGRLLPALATLLDQGAALPPELRAQLDALNHSLAAIGQGEEAAPEKLLLLLSSLRGSQGATSGEAPLLDQLAKLLAELPAESGEAGAATLSRAHLLLSAMAHCNQQVPPQHQPLFWLFPCFFAMGEGAGSWLMQTEAEEGPQGEARYTLSFFLEMSRLGEMQLQVAVQGEEVAGAIYLADEAAMDHLRQELPELKERLSGLGYRVGAFSCALARERLLPAVKSAVEQAAGLAPTRLLDVKA